ncbi:hypothetical protein BO78DRAFT_423476 [Aspergillus sclerotiicarbonarius CBS 121057]|uniref:Uncharacterized protein n=1 Tax=Aspergillus sclerotiicarbonarius (strain CBS 121057 / IBT 28362) TaxID=1448318 RepID=A0A319DUU8_ASPSB|nr:hypothetical protein BO78DRAFT_423476 [Aspergillus sclerotiicarbonarius CBS 121057]
MPPISSPPSPSTLPTIPTTNTKPPHNIPSTKITISSLPTNPTPTSLPPDFFPRYFFSPSYQTRPSISRRESFTPPPTPAYTPVMGSPVLKPVGVRNGDVHGEVEGLDL